MQTTNMDRLGTVLAVFALWAVGCGPPETFDREQMLQDTVEEVISPTHEKLVGAAGDLESSVNEFCSGDRTTSQLEAAREKWRALQAPLKQIQAWSFNMSPYRGKSFGVLVYKVDREPANGEAIETVLEGSETIDASYIADQDYTKSAKGFPAVEYLLFGSPEGGETAPLYQSDGAKPDRRCDYLVATAEHARGVVDAYVNAWDPDGEDFASDFGSRGSKGTNWTTVQDSIDAMVSQMVFVTKQRISKHLLGGPLGQHDTDETVPNTVSSPYANHSLTQIEETFAGMEKLYRGADGKSLADYTKFRKVAVHKDVKNRMEAARSAIGEIPGPLEDAVEEDSKAVESAQGQIDSLTSVIEADLKTTLGASTTRVVVDND